MISLFLARGAIPPAEITIRVDESCDERTATSARQRPYPEKIHRSAPVFSVEYIGYRSAHHGRPHGRAQPGDEPRDQHGLNIPTHRLRNKHHYPTSASP